jgi:hypothetical protein
MTALLPALERTMARGDQEYLEADNDLVWRRKRRKPVLLRASLLAVTTTVTVTFAVAVAFAANAVLQSAFLDTQHGPEKVFQSAQVALLLLFQRRRNGRLHGLIFAVFPA